MSSSTPSATSSSPLNRDSPDPQAGTKRGFDNLLDTLTAKGRKKAKRQVTQYSYMHVLLQPSSSDLNDPNTSPFARAGQWFTRSYSPFMNITTAFHYGLRDGLPDEDEEADEHEQM